MNSSITYLIALGFMLAPFSMGCSDSKRLSHSENQLQLDRETAIALSIPAINQVYGTNQLERKYELKVSQGKGYWVVHYVFLPRTPEDEILVIVEHNKSVTVNGQIVELNSTPTMAPVVKSNSAEWKKLNR